MKLISKEPIQATKTVLFAGSITFTIPTFINYIIVDKIGCVIGCRYSPTLVGNRWSIDDEDGGMYLGQIDLEGEDWGTTWTEV